MQESIAQVTPDEARRLLAQGNALLVDIRDPDSFSRGHVKGAFHLTDASLSRFMLEADFEQPIIVICYHGISSIGAAQYLFNQGFSEVYSLRGGFEAWQKSYPDEVKGQ
ncbi:thiosulfate sulfurtransferase GlpE [Dongshaea marina]|uniref:thiosulfate sulfurtransferase GlpE n=1 Tax=Dongshaea marina TaxID=2047966 RepID=UPI000D3EDC8C|nr:thiosulfate sulfurtransferase GlpE [Dongshaea marina]